MDSDIAPLARRLAEENNVDWRRLAGSGTDGRIVERDVLDYLARVMAGEEDTDPTPEPLPDGMEAWPDQPREAGSDAGPAASAGGSSAAEADGAGSPDDDELLLAGDDLEDEGAVAPRHEPDDELLLGDDEASPPEGDVPDLFAGADTSASSTSGSPDLFLDDEDAAPSGAEDEDTFDFGGLPGAGVRPAAETETVPQEEPPGLDADGRREDGPVETGASGDAPGLDEARFDEPGPVGGPGPGSGAAEPPVPDALAPEQAAGRGAAAALPLARTRAVLRRHVDVTPAFEVRRSVALEAGRDDLPLAALLLAAARRAADRLDVTRPAAAVAGPGGRIGLVASEARGLAELAAEIDAAADDPSDDPEVDLWVVDLSDAGVDEAVLDADAAQLVLGRVLTDRDDGSRRATLSLAADVPLERGTAFLTRVADLLEQPLRLLA